MKMLMSQINGSNALARISKTFFSMAFPLFLMNEELPVILADISNLSNLPHFSSHYCLTTDCFIDNLEKVP